jgi:hypothetical protein
MKKIIERIKEKKDGILAFITVAIVYMVMAYMGVGCPIKFLTGISCAGCGMSRAWMALLHLDIVSAFYYHPLFWMPVFVLILYVMKKKIPWIPIIVLFIVVYIIRLTDSSQDIVVANIHDGFICSRIRFLFNLF